MTNEEQIIRRQYKAAAITGLLANPNFFNEGDEQIALQASAIAQECTDMDDKEYGGFRHLPIEKTEV